MAQKKIYTLSQDNRQKLKITFTEDQLPQVEAQIKRITGWKSPTNRYSSIFERFRSLGSSEHDQIIQQLHPMYGV